MTREDFVKGLAGLNRPDQGMRYHGGGFDHDAPSFDERTGERLSPVHRAAELTVYGDRARFLYRLIEKAGELAAALTAPQPLQGGEVTREQIDALLISAVAPDDPKALYRFFTPEDPYEDRARAVTSILALISPAQREGEG